MCIWGRKEKKTKRKRGEEREIQAPMSWNPQWVFIACPKRMDANFKILALNTFISKFIHSFIHATFVY